MPQIGELDNAVGAGRYMAKRGGHCRAGAGRAELLPGAWSCGWGIAMRVRGEERVGILAGSPGEPTHLLNRATNKQRVLALSWEGAVSCAFLELTD